MCICTTSLHYIANIISKKYPVHLFDDLVYVISFVDPYIGHSDNERPSIVYIPPVCCLLWGDSLSCVLPLMSESAILLPFYLKWWNYFPLLCLMVFPKWLKYTYTNVRYQLPNKFDKQNWLSKYSQAFILGTLSFNLQPVN